MQIVGTELTVMFLSKMQMCFLQSIATATLTPVPLMSYLQVYAVFDYSCHNFLNI